MEVSLNLERNGRYLVGVSGGSDSMALLSLCLQQGYEVVVCHVNYRLRDNADHEEKLVRDYCREKGVTVYVDYPQKQEKGNFQNWAREVRYDFYRRVYEKKNCSALLLGHQKDDYVENYLMSLQRRSACWHYGIARQTVHHGMTIIRPLLDLRKRETREYCLSNGVPFGDDESNATDHYSRNRIRHQLVERADDDQIEEWCRQISELNNKQKNNLDYIRANYDSAEIELSRYRQENDEIRHLILRYLIGKSLPDNPSEAFIRETDRQLLDAKGNRQIRLSKRYALFLDYGTLSVCDLAESYLYQLEKGQLLKTPYFSISSEGQLIERIGVNDDEWPLTVRPPESDDAIELRFGRKKLNRFFIDRKIPRRQRRLWPVVVNCRGEIIFISGVGCEKHHFSTNEYVFMIK